MDRTHPLSFRRRHPWLINGALPALFFALLTVVTTWPLARDLRFATPFDYSDGLLNGWILRWNLHQLAHDPAHLFDAPIMHPWPKTLALSENMLGLSFLFAPLNLLFDDTLLLANAVCLFSFFALGLAAFYVFRRWTSSWWIGLIAGILIGFAPTRFPKLTHFQLLSYWPSVLAVFFAARWLRGARWRDAALFFAALAVQFLFGVYLFIFLMAFLVAFLPAYAVPRLRRLAWRRLAAQGLVGALLLGAVMIPIYRPYRFIRKAWGLQAQPEYIVECSVCPTDFLRFPGSSLLYGKWALRFMNPYSRAPWEQEVALPFTADALAAAGLAGGFVLICRRRRLRGQALWLAGSLAGLLCVSLMFGPVLHVGTAVHPGVPMPYNLLARVLPGLKAVRGVGRFILPASIGLAIMGLLPLSWAMRAMARRRPRLATAVLILLASAMTAECLNAPLPLVPLPGKRELPEAVHRLAALPRGAVLMWPLDFNRNYEFFFLYYQSYFWHPMINGRSGYMPPEHAGTLFKLVERFPSREGVALLQRLGVKYIVVSRGFLIESGRQADDVKLEALEAQGVLRTIYQDLDDRIDQIPDAPGA